MAIADWTRRLGEVQLQRGEPAQAASMLEEALLLYEEMGNLHAAQELRTRYGRHDPAQPGHAAQ